MLWKAVGLYIKYRAASALYRSAKQMLPRSALPLLQLLAMIYIAHEIKKAIGTRELPEPEM